MKAPKKVLKALTVSSLALLSASCIFSASVKSPTQSFDVQFTGVGIAENTAVYAEVGVDVSSLKGQDLTKAIYSMIAHNPSRGSFTYKFDFYISKAGEANPEEVKIYTSRQKRWDDPSLTVVLLSNEVFEPGSSKSISKSSMENPVLVEALRQGTMWVIVKNEIESIDLSYVLTGSGEPYGTDNLTCTFPEPNSKIHDAKVQVSGTANSSIINSVEIYVDNTSLGSSTVDSSGEWDYTIDFVSSNIMPGNHTISVKASPLLGSPIKLDIPVEYMPAISVKEFTVEITAKVTPRGLGFFSWLF